MRKNCLRVFFMVLALFNTTLPYTALQAANIGDKRFAFVASESENNIQVINLDTEQLEDKLPTGKTPHAMAVTSMGKIFVNNRGSKELTLIDSNTVQVLGKIPLPATSFQLSLSPDEKILAVAYKDALKISLIDVATHVVLKTIDIGKLTEGGFQAPMMKHPYWSSDSKFVYASDAVNKAIVKIDASRGLIAKMIDINAANHYLQLSPDNKLLYAVNETRGDTTSLTLIDATTDTIIKDLPVVLAEGERALGHHGAFTPDGKYFLYCNEGGNHISVLDVAKQEWIKTIKTGTGPGHAALSPDGDRFYVIHHNDGIISVIDTASLAIVKNIKISKGNKQAHAAWFTPDGKYFYAIAASDNALIKIDTARMEVASRIPVGANAFFFAIKDGDDFPITEP